MQVDYQMLASVCLGISLSASCGFRIFVPLLAASIAGFNHWIILPADMQWMAGWPALICYGSAAIIEIAAYYIPFLDNVLDTIATPVAFAAGTLLASSLIPLPDDQPLIRWGIGLIAGGAPAGAIQIGTGLLRLFSTKATIGSGNVLIASAENITVFTGVLLSFIIPVFVAVVLILLVTWIILRTIKRIVRQERKIY